MVVSSRIPGQHSKGLQGREPVILWLSGDSTHPVAYRGPPSTCISGVRGIFCQEGFRGFQGSLSFPGVVVCSLWRVANPSVPSLYMANPAKENKINIILLCAVICVFPFACVSRWALFVKLSIFLVMVKTHVVVKGL